MTGLATLKPEDRTQGMSDLTKALQGTSVAPLFSEDFKTLKFDDLASKLTAADSKAAESPDDFLLHLQVTYALLRDARYSHAGRRFCKALGANSAFRGFYEGGKFYVDTAGRSAQ